MAATRLKRQSERTSARVAADRRQPMNAKRPAMSVNKEAALMAKTNTGGIFDRHRLSSAFNSSPSSTNAQPNAARIAYAGFTKRTQFN
jgi:hypothetical protein